MRKTLQTIEEELFNCIYGWGQTRVITDEKGDYLQKLFKEYRIETLRLEKQRKIEDMFNEELEIHKEERVSTHNHPDSSCGYAGHPAK